jgi:hypothetical protein
MSGLNDVGEPRYAAAASQRAPSPNCIRELEVGNETAVTKLSERIKYVVAFLADERKVHDSPLWCGYRHVQPFG